MRKNTAEHSLAHSLAHIPSEYQELFRATMTREMREAEEDHTDQDMLVYLRRRLEDVSRGDFIRPDGKTGTTTLETTAALQATINDVAGVAASKSAVRQQERRQTFLKAGAILLLLAVLFLVVFNGRRQRAAEVEVAPEATATSPAETVRGLNDLLPPTPTPVMPGSADEALQTIGGLGGSLTLGRPSALEIRYLATEEVVALPIDPARISNRGEMPYNAATMASDNPVAVWVFGTVLNYAIGLPESLVVALQPGDRLRLTTDTGFALSFIVTQTARRANHEAGDLLSQNRVGMTLFALPASRADAVPVALAGYDLTGEDAQTAVYRPIGDPFFPGGDLKLTAVSFSDSRDNQLIVTLEGTGHGDGQLSLHGRSHQTTAVALPERERWQLTFLLPETVIGETLTAVYRELPGGQSAFIALGEAPRLVAQLETGDPHAYWQAATGELVVTVEVTNPTPGLVRLPGDYIQLLTEGGETDGQLTMMAQYLEPGETRHLRLTFPLASPTTPFGLQVGQWRWAGEG